MPPGSACRRSVSASTPSGGCMSWRWPEAGGPTAMADRSLEREVKLAAWPGFRLPDLAGVAGFAEVQPEVQRQLDAVYYDASDLRLIRAGAPVRHRSGDGEPTWTVKV